MIMKLILKDNKKKLKYLYFKKKIDLSLIISIKYINIES